MKSIKEASVAYGREHNGTVNIKDFEAGANYVLEEIETITKADLGSYKSQLDRIKNVIKQLKK